MEDYKYKDLTRTIIGSAMRVHQALGVGFPEVVYQRSLSIELRHNGLQFEQEIHLPLYYRGEPVGSRRADFLIEQVVLVELKAVTELTALSYTQIINYLNAYQLEVGLLINFGEASLRFKRFIKSQQFPPTCSPRQ